MKIIRKLYENYVKLYENYMKIIRKLYENCMFNVCINI